MTWIVAGCSVALWGVAIVLGWWLREAVAAERLPRPRFVDLPAATARQIRKAQKKQRLELREVLRRDR
jgi:hypothetical protein